MSRTAAYKSLSKVTVVIVTFNSAHCIRRLANALLGFKSVVVVDNASSDATVSEVRRLIAQAVVLTNEKNIGFGAANNRALRCVDTPYCLLLNPDCAVDAQSVDRLTQVADQFDNAAIVAPQLCFADGTPNVDYRWKSTDWRSRGVGADAMCCVGFACGAAMLLNMHLMRRVGFFDEGFFLYYEDDDLCLRVVNSGYAIVVEPSVRAVHQSRGSVGRAQWWRSEYLRGYHHAQSKIRFLVKYPALGNAKRKRSTTLLLALFALPLRLLIFSPRHVCRLVGRISGLIALRQIAV